ncbi:MAG: rhodanese-like domain-containing protein [Acidimicrobiia bacterium]|nr:rhodanese-like domain-containing protein [Acidimicrobiia bacterium]
MTEHPDAPVVNVHIPYERHIAGTDAFVPFDEIAQWDALPADLDAPIVLYCRSGNMSAEAATTLTGLGYTDIVDLEGGMNAWAAAGLPLLDQDPAAG